MKYRIKEVCFGDGWSEVTIQCKRFWRWRDVWHRPFYHTDRDYALLCADELKEHLEAEI